MPFRHLLADYIQTKLCCAIANNVCKFDEDRLNDGVTIYFIVAKPRGSSETLSRFFATCALCNACAVSVTHRTTCRAACVWTAVWSVYGEPKKQKRKYISGIAAMTAGQILVSTTLIKVITYFYVLFAIISMMIKVYHRRKMEKYYI